MIWSKGTTSVSIPGAKSLRARYAVVSVPGTATLAAPAGVGGSQLALPRNIIDGGDFTTNPWQRGTSFTGIAGAATYTADRFFAVGGASSSISVSQVTGITAVPGFTQALQFGRGGSPIVVAEHHAQHRRRAHVAGQIDAHTLLFEAREILTERPPVGIDLVMFVSGAIRRDDGIV